ncbi:MAG: hypothetical protein HC853_11980 [Anaerolineae bacterium]|nr:hypothetical protein [Anaerolineae bacterium]
MALHSFSKLGFSALGAGAAIVTAVATATTGVVSTFSSFIAASTPVPYPLMSQTNRLEKPNDSTLRGLNFDPNEQVSLFILLSPEATVAQYLPWVQVQTNAEGQFEQTLGQGFPDNMPPLFYVSAYGKRGYVAPIGPLRLFKAAPALTPTPAPDSALAAPTVVPTTVPFQPTLVPTVLLPTPTPKPVDRNPTDAFVADYFNNRDLNDAPVVARNESVINVTFGFINALGSKSGSTSARFFGTFTFDETESYEFVVQAKDGVRMWVDGVLVLNDWRTGPSRPLRVDVPLGRGTHTVQVEYFNVGNGAQLRVTWSARYSRWEARYYNSPDWTGAVVLKRDDGEADGRLRFDWADRSPAPGVNPDNFSAIWERRVMFDVTGDYTFTLDLDDGAKVYIDGVEVFNNVRAVGQHTFTRRVTRGQHSIQVLYAEYGGGAKLVFDWVLVPPAPVPVP